MSVQAAVLLIGIFSVVMKQALGMSFFADEFAGVLVGTAGKDVCKLAQVFCAAEHSTPAHWSCCRLPQPEGDELGSHQYCFVLSFSAAYVGIMLTSPSFLSVLSFDCFLARMFSIFRVFPFSFFFWMCC